MKFKFIMHIISANLMLFAPLTGKGWEYTTLWNNAYEAHLNAQTMHVRISDEQETNEKMEDESNSSRTGGQRLPEEVSEPVAEIPAPTKGDDENSMAGPSSEILGESQAQEPGTVVSEVTEVVHIYPKYSVNGAKLGDDLQEYLYGALADRGIAWFFPYALLIAYQESKYELFANQLILPVRTYIPGFGWGAIYGDLAE